MTCIVGYVDKETGDIYIGGDSIGYGDLSWSIITDPKVFIKENIIIGYASSFRMGQILKYSLKIPKRNKKIKNDMEYLCSIFIPELMKTLEKEKFSPSNLEQCGTFLIGYNKHLYVVSENFQVLEDIKNYEAIGCGEDYAKGALCILENNNIIPPEEKIRLALDAASQFSMVKEPFNILILKNK